MSLKYLMVRKIDAFSGKIEQWIFMPLTALLRFSFIILIIISDYESSSSMLSINLSVPSGRSHLKATSIRTLKSWPRALAS